MSAPFITKVVRALFPNHQPDVPQLLQLPKFLKELEPKVDKTAHDKLVVKEFFNPSKPLFGRQKTLSRLLKAHSFQRIKNHLLARNKANPNDHSIQFFMCSSHPYAKCWLYSNSLDISDQTTMDNGLIDIGLDPFLPNVCCVCKQPSPSRSSLDHAKGCGNAVHSPVGAAIKAACKDTFALLGLPCSK